MWHYELSKENSRNFKLMSNTYSLMLIIHMFVLYIEKQQHRALFSMFPLILHYHLNHLHFRELAKIMLPSSVRICLGSLTWNACLHVFSQAGNYIILYYIILYYIILYYIILYYIILYYIILYYIILYYITLHYITLHCIVLYCISVEIWCNTLDRCTFWLL
jgi:hypothetical protein